MHKNKRQFAVRHFLVMGHMADQFAGAGAAAGQATVTGVGSSLADAAGTSAGAVTCSSIAGIPTGRGF